MTCSCISTPCSLLFLLPLSNPFPMKNPKSGPSPRDVTNCSQRNAQSVRAKLHTFMAGSLAVRFFFIMMTIKSIASALRSSSLLSLTIATAHKASKRFSRYSSSSESLGSALRNLAMACSKVSTPLSSKIRFLFASLVCSRIANISLEYVLLLSLSPDSTRFRSHRKIEESFTASATSGFRSIMFSSSVRVWKTASASSSSFLSPSEHRCRTPSSSPTTLFSTRLSTSITASPSLSSTLSPSRSSESTSVTSLVMLVFSCVMRLRSKGTPSSRISRG
mmetsp:Transcript_6455/g.19090  ORF Transcript_6455/g.19090 Transcript_6455/m.19090 type:complete len:277 (+) Transcript_6455:4007-4837(+)